MSSSTSTSSSSSSSFQQQQPKEEEEVKEVKDDGRIGGGGGDSGGGDGGSGGDDDEKKKDQQQQQQSQQQPVVLLDQYYENYSWKEIPNNFIKESISILGYTEHIWDNNLLPSTEDYDWIDLSTKQRQAAIRLGYNQELWDTTYDNDTDNDDTDDNKQKKKSKNNYIVYCIQLYTETDDYKFIIDNKMKGLCMVVNRPMKKDELIIQSPVGPIAYNDRLFKPPPDATSSSSSSSSSSELLELSPERQKFANEFFKWQDKYYYNSKNNKEETIVPGITRDRVILTLDDFKNPLPLKTSKTTTTTNNDNNNSNNDNDNDDDDDDDIHTPTEDSPEYCFDNLTEKDVVVVQFVSPTTKNDSNNNSNSNYNLPPERQFEILPYDECIGMYGEENYQPSILLCQRRPPTLFYMNGSRTLTIPGHFVNHACLSSATVYDVYRLLEKEEEDEEKLLTKTTTTTTTTTTEGQQRHRRRHVVAPAQPAWVQKNLDEYVNNNKSSIGGGGGCDRHRNNNNNNNNLSKLLKYVNALTTYHDMEIGDEVTTDYALFHWSNEDCIPNGPSCFEPLSTTTSNNNDDNDDEQHYLVDDDDNIYEGSSWLEPWFNCCCGNNKCHSKFGFKGMKYFPLEEQKRLYWICTPWIQNQIDWKLYKLENEREKERQRRQTNNNNNNINN